MSDVSFDEEPSYSRPRPQEASTKSSFNGLIIKLHLAKDDVGAQRVLLIIAGACLALAAFVFIGSIFSSSAPTPVTPQALPVRTQ